MLFSISDSKVQMTRHPAISVHQPLLDKTTRRRPSNLALNKHLRDSTVVFTMVPVRVSLMPPRALIALPPDPLSSCTCLGLFWGFPLVYGLLGTSLAATSWACRRLIAGRARLLKA